MDLDQNTTLISTDLPPTKQVKDTCIQKQVQYTICEDLFLSLIYPFLIHEWIFWMDLLDSTEDEGRICFDEPGQYPCIQLLKSNYQASNKCFSGFYLWLMTQLRAYDNFCVLYHERMSPTIKVKFLIMSVSHTLMLFS